MARRQKINATSNGGTAVAEDGCFAVMMLLRLLIYLIEFRKDSSVSCHEFITGSLQVAIGYGHAVCLLTTSKGGQLTNSFVYYHLVYSSGFIWNVPANIWSLSFLILLTPAVTAAFLSCKILLPLMSLFP